ncbi:TonB-dependent siderophore receptor [Pelagerythrobacter aerophilus]
MAQDASADSATQPAEQTETREIVVTGARANRFGTDTVQSGSFRNAKVLDVPLTVSVIPDEVLKSQQAVDLIDAVRNTAGVSTAFVGPVAYNLITVRGIELDTRANYKMDGALNMLSSTQFPLENKDRVEVLKGASALYYGFSSPGGIINLTMKRPTRDLYVGARAFADSHGSLGIHGDVGDTVGAFGYRINGLYAGLDSGVDYSKGHRYFVSGAFDFKPTDNLTLYLNAEHFERVIAEPSTIRVRYNPATTDGLVPDLTRLDPSHNIAGALWADNNTSELNLLGKAIYEITTDWNISAFYGISNLTRIRNNPRFDFDRIDRTIDPSRPSDLSTGDGAATFIAQDTRFENENYAVELAGTLRLHDNIKNEILVGASRAIRKLASPSAGRFSRPQNVYNPRFIPLSEVQNDLVFEPRPDPSTVDDKGLYLFNRLSFNDVFTILGGARYSDYSNDGSVNVSNSEGYTASTWSFSGGAVIKPVRWVSLYGTYIEGLEETDIAPVDATNQFESFAPTKSVQYEAGIKLQPKSDLLFQAAYFNITQGATYLGLDPAGPTPDGRDQKFFNDADNRYEGVEFSLTGYVLPDLALYATATAFSAKYENNPQLAGLRVEGAPKNTWSLAGEYTVSWLDPGLKFSAGAYHTGSQAVNALNNAFTEPYTTYDLGASYTFETERGHEIVARINGQNITNERYFASVKGGTFGLSTPSTVRFSLAFRY